MSVPSGIVSIVSPRISAISLRVSGNKANYFFRDQTLSVAYNYACYLFNFSFKKLKFHQNKIECSFYSPSTQLVSFTFGEYRYYSHVILR